MRNRRGYEKVPQDEIEDEDVPDVKVGTKQHSSKYLPHFLPEQFKCAERPVPWKAIGYAVLLFVVGTILLLCGCLIHTGHVDNQRFGDRLWPLIIFGSLMFIPGSYHVFIAVQTLRGVPGYNFDEYPSFD